MNFVAIIGIIEKKWKEKDDMIVIVKVEKKNQKSGEDYFEKIYCRINVDILKELKPKHITIDSIVGIKGYLSSEKYSLQAERFQIF